MTPRDQLITRLFTERKTDEEIGAVVGLKPRTVRKERGRLHLVRPRVVHAENLRPRRPQLDREYIQRQYTGPESIGHIAQALGADPDSIRRILRDELGIYAHGPRAEVDPEAVARADDLLDGTIPFEEVAKTVGLTVEQLKYRFPGRGLKQENQGALRVARELAEGLGL